MGMSQSELARRSGMTPAAICQIEAGDREPSLKTILAILTVFPCSFETLAITDLPKTKSGWKEVGK